MFANEFLDRYPNDNQLEVIRAVTGDKAGVWNKDFHEIVIPVGMKGGKNYVVEIIVAFICYFIKCLRDPHEYFSKITGRNIPYPQDKNFDIANVSVSGETQARHVFFDTIKSVIRLTKDPKTNDNWFERYAKLNLRPGGFGDLKEKIITFPTDKTGKGTIRLMSFNSDAAAPEGSHFLLYLADELSRADTKAEYMRAKKLLQLGLSNTAASFPKKVGKTLEWAYLNDTDWDLTNERYELGLTNNFIFAKKFTTWDFNPTVSEEDFEHEKRADETVYNQIRKCIKPLSKDNFFQPYTEKIKEAVDKEIPNLIEYKTTIIKRTDNKQTREFTSIEILKLLGDKKERCWAHDPGKNKDRYVIAGGYNETIDAKKLEFFVDDKYEVLYTNKRPVIDVIIVIDPIQRRTIDYLGVGDIWTQLLRAFPNSQSVNSDIFQNEKFRQEIIAKGISADSYGFSNPQQISLYTKVRACVHQNNLTICCDTVPHHVISWGGKRYSPSDLWIWESEKIIKDGQKIDHPKDGSKDISDVVAILVHDLLALEAKGSAGMASSLDDLTEEKFRQLVEKFMDIKYELELSGIQKDLVLQRVSEKMNMSIEDVAKIEKYVQENYSL